MTTKTTVYTTWTCEGCGAQATTNNDGRRTMPENWYSVELARPHMPDPLDRVGKDFCPACYGRLWSEFCRDCREGPQP